MTVVHVDFRSRRRIDPPAATPLPRETRSMFEIMAERAQQARAEAEARAAQRKGA